jgi:hypothetical protein
VETAPAKSGDRDVGDECFSLVRMRVVPWPVDRDMKSESGAFHRTRGATGQTLRVDGEADSGMKEACRPDCKSEVIKNAREEKCLAFPMVCPFSMGPAIAPESSGPASDVAGVGSPDSDVIRGQQRRATCGWAGKAGFQRPIEKVGLCVWTEWGGGNDGVRRVTARPSPSLRAVVAKEQTF